MTEYQDFPPFVNLKTLLISKPTAALLYIQLWKRKRASNMLSVDKKTLRKDYLISRTLFRNFMLSLTRIGVLTFAETNESFVLNFFTSPSSPNNA